MIIRKNPGEYQKEDFSYEYVYEKYENLMMVNGFYAFYRNIL